MTDHPLTERQQEILSNFDKISFRQTQFQGGMNFNRWTYLGKDVTSIVRALLKKGYVERFKTPQGQFRLRRKEPATA